MHDSTTEELYNRLMRPGRGFPDSTKELCYRLLGTGKINMAASTQAKHWEALWNSLSPYSGYVRSLEEVNAIKVELDYRLMGTGRGFPCL